LAKPGTDGGVEIVLSSRCGCHEAAIISVPALEFVESVKAVGGCVPSLIIAVYRGQHAKTSQKAKK
jgi:hypothetical protein